MVPEFEPPVVEEPVPPLVVDPDEPVEVADEEVTTIAVGRAPGGRPPGLALKPKETLPPGGMSAFQESPRIW